MQVYPNHRSHPVRRRLLSQSRSLLSRWAASCALLFISAAAQAATLNVPSATYPTIQSAVNAASAGDTIQVAAGVYPESLDWENKDLTITGAGAGQTIVDPSQGGGGRGIYTENLTAASRLDGFTIQNGRVVGTDNGGSSYGGGMYNNNSSLQVIKCTFINNTALSGSNDDHNGGNGYGGGMYNTSSLRVVNCTFIGNTAQGGTSTTFGGNGCGGGIYSKSNLQVTNCVFLGNTAQGGIGYSAVGPIGGDGLGGGLYGDDSLQVTNCTFTSNMARESGLSGSAHGGGVCSRNSLYVTNSILAGNNFAVDKGSASGRNVYSRNNILLSHSDVQDYGLPATPDANGNFGAGPRFVDAANGDLHLQAVSPCIDAGEDTVITAPPFLTDPNGTPLDLSGLPRISRAHVDLGAYEYTNQAPVANAGGNQTVTIPHDGNPATNTVNVTLDGSKSYDPEGDGFTYQWIDSQNNVIGSSAKLPLTLTAGTYSYTLIVTDTYSASASQSVTITVNPEPNQAPVANAGSSQTVEGRGASTPVTLDGSKSSDPDGDRLTYRWSEGGTLLGTTAILNVSLPYGSHTLTLIVTDPYGASSQATVTVNIVDTTIPVVTASASQTQLWPPNGKTVPVVVSGKVTDGGSGIDLSSGSYTVQDSEGTVQPSGSFRINADGTYSVSVPLVASRNGNNQAGRIYTITISARDKAGNAGKATVTVTVPHDQGR